MSEALLVFWDVQHGHAAYIKTPNDRHIVVDLGTGSYGSDRAFSPLNHLTRHYHVTQIDHVIVTHPHVDHIDDIFSFDLLTPKVFTRPNHLNRQPIIQGATNNDRAKILKYFEISDSYNANIPSNSSNESGNPSNWGGLVIKSYHPTNCPENNINNHSIVMYFEYEGISVLIPGDNESASWQEIMNIPGFLSTTRYLDVLLAPHHGRDSGFNADAMNNFNPRLTVVSDGPFCDTSATARYAAISRGWDIHKRFGGEDVHRKCLTTRNDGVVSLNFGRDAQNQRYLSVTVD